MVNLTVTINEELLRRARIRALEEGTSVNAKVRGYLEAYAGSSPAETAIAHILDLAVQSQARDRSEGRSWTRDEVHERV